MASSSHALKEYDNSTDVTYALVSQTVDGAAYRVASRSLGLPQSLDVRFKIGNPGSKGNDKLVISMKNTVQNSETLLVSTGSISVQISVPRDIASFTATDGRDLIHQLAEFLILDGTINALLDGVTP